MDNKKKKEKDVSVQYIPVCGVDRRCCANNSGCQASQRYLPETGQYIFVTCGC